LDAQPGPVAELEEEPPSTEWAKSYDGESYTRRVGNVRAEVCRDERHEWTVMLTPVAFQFGGWTASGPRQTVGSFEGRRLAKREGDVQLAGADVNSGALPSSPCTCTLLQLSGTRDRLRVPLRTCPVHRCTASTSSGPASARRYPSRSGTLTRSIAATRHEESSDVCTMSMSRSSVECRGHTSTVASFAGSDARRCAEWPSAERGD